jgi:hypothetical protein
MYCYSSLFLLAFGCLLLIIVISLSLTYWYDIKDLNSELALKNLLYHCRCFALFLIAATLIIFSSYSVSRDLGTSSTILYFVCFLALLSLRLRVSYMSRKKQKIPLPIIINSMTLIGKTVGSLCFISLIHILIISLDGLINTFFDLIPLFMITFVQLCNGFFGNLKLDEKGISGNLFFLNWEEVNFVIYGKDSGVCGDQYLDIQHNGLWPIYRNFRVHVEIPDDLEDKVLQAFSRSIPVACRLNS